MKIMSKIHIPSFAAFAALFLFCGGSEIGNPRVITTGISGAICDPSGTRMAAVNLFLIDASHSDSQQLVPDAFKTTITGADGSYQFSEVFEGKFDLFGSTTNGDSMFLQRIDLSGNDSHASPDGTFREGLDTIKQVAKVIVNVKSCPSRNDEFIFVPGTIIHVPVDSCGEYLVKCPASKIDLLYYKNNSLEMLDGNLNLSAGQWLDLTGKSYTIPKPAVISGAVIGIVGQMYQFSVDSIDLGPIHPIQYRFSWGDSISLWNFSATSGHIWNKAGTYDVSVQARSLRDTLSLSEWSDSSVVTIQ
jgi:hypothetical protein